MVFGMLALVLAKAAAVLTPQVLKHTIDDLAIEVTSEKLLLYASLIVGIAAVEGFFRFWMRRLLIGVSRRVEYDLRGDFYGHLQKMSPSFFHRWRTAVMSFEARMEIGRAHV